MRLPHQKYVRGFTLLELLIVITIISIVIGLATLSTGLIGNVPLEREAKRLHALIDQVSKEAIIQSKVIGIHLRIIVTLFLNYKMINGKYYPKTTPLKPAHSPIH